MDQPQTLSQMLRRFMGQKRAKAASTAIKKAIVRPRSWANG